MPARPGGVKRLLHLASFALSSLPSLLRAAAGRPDVILVVEPALFCAPAAWLAARLCGARAWLHVQDYEVDAAFELGLLKGAWLRRAVARAERWLMRRFDRVSTISERMLALARDKGVEPARAVLLPNWIDAQAITPDLDGGAYRAQLGIPADAIVALYSGNMGGKQGLQVLADVARRLEGETRLWFVFCGQGPERAALQARCAGLARARFLDLQPAERLGELLCMADIHLLPQRGRGRPRHAVQADRHAGQRPSCGLRRRAGHGTGGRDHALRPVDSPKTRRPWPRPCSAWRKTARPGPRWARPRGAMPWLICTWTRCWARPSANWRPLPSRAGHRPRAPATPDGVRPITPKVRAASAAGPRR